MAVSDIYGLKLVYVRLPDNTPDASGQIFIVQAIRVHAKKDMNSREQHIVSKCLSRIKHHHPELKEQSFSRFLIESSPSSENRVRLRLTSTMPSRLLKGQQVLMVFRVVQELNAEGLVTDVARLETEDVSGDHKEYVLEGEDAVELKLLINQVRENPFSTSLLPKSVPAINQYSIEEVYALVAPAVDQKYMVRGIEIQIKETIGGSEEMDTMGTEILKECLKRIEAAHPEFNISSALAEEFTALFIDSTPAPTEENPTRKWITLNKAMPRELTKGQVILMVFRIVQEWNAAGPVRNIAVMPQEEPSGNIAVYELQAHPEVRQSIKEVRENPFKGLVLPDSESQAPTETSDGKEDVDALMEIIRAIEESMRRLTTGSGQSNDANVRRL